MHFNSGLSDIQLALEVSCRLQLHGAIYRSDSFVLMLKSVQSALSDLLTTSATQSTFCLPSTKRGLILIGLELNTNAREPFEHC